MKAYRLDHFTSLDDLRLQEEDDPRLQRDRWLAGRAEGHQPGIGRPHWISDGFLTFDRVRKGGCVEKVLSHREELHGQLRIFHKGNFFWCLCSYR